LRAGRVGPRCGGSRAASRRLPGGLRRC
jgi:hypothetical protein